ncbi:hypothetical protein BCR33DRAFT_738564 [Rhizoclosmatium globosum]|uniref:GRIP domain-containing protein n=1 Tax=Rhizoclosmatium globosum TaxID=329046 RepID=A0A1Y2CA99_9FUNG|nr:hypothetical protein BCR33DRAFT_738564 [Rhizoclosmatium globosum]|eukprot:ORY43866.1 hypothetical protein BCR33DRAFT_738564 [Rhizoclosmatium globosum]
MLKDGVTVGDESKLQQLDSYLLDQKVKIQTSSTINESLKQEVTALKESERLRIMELEQKNQNIKNLQSLVETQEEEIKSLKSSSASRAPSPIRCSGSIDTKQKSVSSPITSPSNMKTTTPTTPSLSEKSSFFNFQTMLSTTMKSSSTPSTPTQPTAVVTEPQPPSDAASTLQMKLKIRDLANALKKVTEQRDLAIVRIKELQATTNNHNTLSVPYTENRRNSVDELVAVSADSTSHSNGHHTLVTVDLDARRNSGDSVSGLLGSIPSDYYDGATSTSTPSSTTIPLIRSSSQDPLRQRIKDLETQLETVQTQLYEQTELTKKLRANNATTSSTSTTSVRKRLSFIEVSSSRNSTSSINNDAEVSGVEQELLEARETISTLQVQLRDTAAERDEEIERSYELQKRILEAEDAKREVQGKLDSVDQRHAESLDSIAAVNDVTVKTLEDEVENWKRKLKAETENLRVATAELEALKKEKEGVEAVVVKLEDEVKKLTAANEGAVQGLVESEKTRKTALDDAEALKGKLGVVEKELSAVKEKLAELQSNYDTSLETIRAQKESEKTMQERIDSAESSQRDTVGKLDKAFAVIRKLKTDAESRDAAKNQLENDLQTASESLKALEVEVEKLRAEVKLLKESESTETTKSVETFTVSEPIIQTVVETVADPKVVEELASASSQIVVLTSQIEELNQVNESLQTASKKQQEDAEALQRRIATLEGELATANASIASTIDDPLTQSCTHTNIDALEQTITSLRAQLESVVPKEMTLHKELEHAKSDLSDARMKLQALESLKKELEAQLETTSTAHKEAVAKMDKAYAVVRKMRTDADNRARESEVMKAELEALKSASNLALNATTSADAEKEIAQLKEKVEELTLLNESVQSQCDHEGIIVSLRQRIVELEGLISSEDPQSRTVNEDVDTLQNTISLLRSQLAEQQKSHVIGDDIESVRAELAETRAKLESLESAKAALQTRTSMESSSAPTMTNSTSLEFKISLINNQLHSAQEALAQEKQTTQKHLDTIRTKDVELVQTKVKLTEEEEKKNKSIQLLRNMKAKILKLEDMVQARDIELGAIKDELKELRSNSSTGTAERDAKLIALTKQVDEMGTRIRKQNDDLFQLEKSHDAKSLELEAQNGKLKELNGKYERAIAERDSLIAADKQRLEEMTATKLTMSLQSNQLTDWNERVKDLEFRISNLDDELATSKRLFENKSIEYEALQLKLAEVERQFYEKELSVGLNSDEVDQLRREIIQLRREVGNQGKAVREAETLLASVKEEKDVSETLRIKMEKQCDVLTKDLERLKSKILEYNSKEDEWKATLHQIELLKSGKELEINSRTQELRNKLEAQDKLVEDAKTRENQLLKLNKSLKDEVRRLARSIGISTPIMSPPLSHHNSGLDEKEIAAANAALGMNPLSLNSRKSSIAGGLDLGGSSNGLDWGATIGTKPATSSPFPMNPPSRNNSISSTTSNGPQSAARLAANEEYLKNVVLRFVESKRATKLQMVPALGMLLRLTPEEVKRVQKCI